jgi:hypothetical protein
VEIVAPIEAQRAPTEREKEAPAAQTPASQSPARSAKAGTPEFIFENWLEKYVVFPPVDNVYAASDAWQSYQRYISGDKRRKSKGMTRLDFGRTFQAAMVAGGYARQPGDGQVLFAKAA